MNGNISRRARISNLFSFSYFNKIIEEKKKEGIRIYNLFNFNPPISLELYEDAKETNLIERFVNFYGIQGDFKVIIFPGTLPALSTIFYTFLDTNDEILVPEPILYYLNPCIDLSHIKLKAIKTYYYNNFSIPSRDLIEPLINPRIKGIFISNPNFFSGNIYSEEEIDRIIFLSNTYSIPLFFDETFSYSIFKDVVFRSILNSKLNHHNLFVINRIIEIYSGINLVFVITTPINYEILKRYRDEFFPINNILLASGTRFFIKFIENIEMLKRKILNNAEYMYKTLLSKDISIIKPFAGACAILKIPVDDAENFVKFMIESYNENNSTVFVLPMSNFFEEKEKGKELICINFTMLEREELEEGLKILKSGISTYLKEVK